MRRDFSLTLAFCASLGVHAWGLYALIVAEDRALSRRAEQLAHPLPRPVPVTPPEVRQTNPPRPPEPRPVAERPVELLPAPPPPPALLAFRPLPLLPPPPPPPEPDPEDERHFGESWGKGDAINASAGAALIQARQNPFEQAFLSRDPVGTGQVGNEPSMVLEQSSAARKTGTTPEGGRGGNAAEQRQAVLAMVPSKAPLILPVGVPPPAPQLPPPRPRTPRGESENAPNEPNPEPIRPAEPAPVAPQPDPARQQLALAPSSVLRPSEENLPSPVAVARRSAAVAAGTGGGATAGEAGAANTSSAADPAPMSDSESDAFSKVGTATFVNGRLEPRFGRKVKTVRPSFDTSARLDVLAIPRPSVQLEVHADATGRPTLVGIVKSSGSNSIDQPVRLALYKWWFEPPKDRNGNPKADVMLWTIHLR